MRFKATRGNMTRRTFVKAVVTGLVTFVPVINTLLSLSKAYANNCAVSVCYNVAARWECWEHTLTYCTQKRCVAIDGSGVVCALFWECSPQGCC